jgi:5-(carboxyamino)imidazole ribonucleotide synthase
VVGVVGGGQLARMLFEAASALGIDTVLLSEQPDDAAVAAAGRVLVGTPGDLLAMEALAACADVITFDHEQVDLAVLSQLAEHGTTVLPGVAALELAVDKATMRQRFFDAGVAVPDFEVLDLRQGAAVAMAAIGRVAGRAGWPVMAKATRGGYDGKGVWPLESKEAAAAAVERSIASGASTLLVEAMVPIDTELAVLVATGTDGTSVAWPAVETTQVDGVCREVLAPGHLSADLLARAGDMARRAAREVAAVGVLAVELFATGGEVLVNEVAARPHNTGHWSIEGATTSQFENHLRAVLSLPLGSTAPRAPAVASVNVFGPADGSDPRRMLAGALRVEGAHVHLYGKEARPGRKLGHVTVLGDDPDDARRRAWQCAGALGTLPPPGVRLD